ncbi:unannotated protein [freshwater metagenome]|uniref:Unannotated protein n=1 Tax=freshwater metagenome TaxID=449393 RepID=A0A6J6Y6M6_9ZZZZ
MAIDDVVDVVVIDRNRCWLARSDVGEKRGNRCYVVTLGKAFAVGQASFGKDGIGVEKSVAGDGCDFEPGVFRKECGKSFAERALADSNSASDPHDDGGTLDRLRSNDERQDWVEIGWAHNETLGRSGSQGEVELPVVLHSSHCPIIGSAHRSRGTEHGYADRSWHC